MDWYHDLIKRTKSIIVKGFRQAMCSDAGEEFHIKVAPEIETICENCRLDPPPECKDYEHIPDDEYVLLDQPPTKQVPENTFLLLIKF